MKKRVIFFIIILSLLISSFITCVFYFKVYKNYDNNLENSNTNIVDEKEFVEEVKRVKISMVGDLLYEEPYYDSIDAGDDKTRYLSNMKKYFLNDDLTLSNLEVVITNGNLKVSGEGYSFCAPQYVGEQLIDVGMDVLAKLYN